MIVFFLKLLFAENSGGTAKPRPVAEVFCRFVHRKEVCVMKHRNLIKSALFLAMGLILHAVTPGMFGMMKPDFLLATFFVTLLIVTSFQEAFVISMVCGILAALTTTIPGGEIANIVDKLITGLVMYHVAKQLRASKPLTKTFGIAAIGTIISGAIFLGVLTLLQVLPAPLMSMVMVVVLPTAVANSIIFYILLKVPYLKQS